MAATADATAATAKRERVATADQAAVDAAVEARPRAEADTALVHHDAALPRALAAEQEAPPQKKDWDATANRARLALERAPRNAPLLLLQRSMAVARLVAMTSPLATPSSSTKLWPSSTSTPKPSPSRTFGPS